MEDQTIILVSVFAAAWLLVFIIAIMLWVRVSRLQRIAEEMQATGRIRVQKLRINGSDKNHAFQNPALAPDEELSRRGYSMYRPEDVESGRGTSTDRQAGGQFVEELTREIDYRQQRRSASPALQDPRNLADPRPDYHLADPRSHNYDRGLDVRRDFDPRVDNRQTTAPPFLLQAIEDNKRKSRLANPVANGGRQSDTNPNFIY